MAFKVLIAVFVVLAVTFAVPAPAAGGWGAPAAGGWGPPGVNPFIPPWISGAPWMPQWTPCTPVGKTCQDCFTTNVCTPFGQIKNKHISVCPATTPYCNNGECSATASAECAGAATTAA